MAKGASGEEESNPDPNPETCGHQQRLTVRVGARDRRRRGAQEKRGSKEMRPSDHAALSRSASLSLRRASVVYTCS